MRQQGNISPADAAEQSSGRRPAAKEGTMVTMANINALLKTEIARIARRELRSETEQMKKASSSYRAEIAALKRRVQDLEKELRRVKKAGPGEAEERTTEDQQSSLRFSAKGLANHRRRLGLSAREVGDLVGASSLAVFKWEKGKARPRARFLPAIAMLRTMGKREAASRLQALH